MKVKIPVPGKKNRKNAEPEPEHVMFDLTGDRDDSTSPERGPGRRQVQTQEISFGAPDPDAFEVSVRNADAIMRRIEKGGKVKAWASDLQLNLALAGTLMAMFTLLMTSMGEPILILYCLPAVAVVMLMTTLEALGRDKVRLYTAAALFVLLIAAVIILRKYIGNGLGLIMNQLYDASEAEQAYLYDRFHIGSTGEEHPYRSMHMASLWVSALVGLITSMPPVIYRRSVALAVAVFSMIAFAYYGILPEMVCVAVLLAALVFVLSRGSLISSLPVILVAAILFGAIVFFDPGENYGISRVDENFRDRFAFRSSYLDDEGSMENDISGIENGLQDNEEDLQDEEETTAARHRGTVAIVVILLILAAAAVLAARLLQRLRKQQARNRAGIDSSDPKEAISAMFPYAVRWLQPAGIETKGKAFRALVPAISSELSEEYAGRYSGMYEMWEEATYSDHEMDEERKKEMNTFMEDTIRMIREKGNFFTNILDTIRYAL